MINPFEKLGNLKKNFQKWINQDEMIMIKYPQGSIIFLKNVKKNHTKIHLGKIFIIQFSNLRPDWMNSYFVIVFFFWSKWKLINSFFCDCVNVELMVDADFWFDIISLGKFPENSFNYNSIVYRFSGLINFVFWIF